MIGPRGLLVAAAASRSGKTTVTLGLLAALRAAGHRVAAAKCGPDYIDPMFLAAACGGPTINLDPWAMAPDALRSRLAGHAAGAELMIVEGVMGLYDGGPGGAGSTAALAMLSGLPVLLVIGAEGLAQTSAAVAEGCARLADGFAVAGAIVNHVASERHAALIREGFGRAGVPLLGLVRRDPKIALPSRHLGLVQAAEHVDLAAKIERAGRLVAAGCDLDRIAATAAPLPQPPRAPRAGLPPLGQRIAVARDLAFGFSYPHLLQDWRDAGAELAFFSPLAGEGPRPDADAVFLPGGYPELHAERIAAAGGFRAGMAAAQRRGSLIYGECGGYMALGRSLEDAEGRTHEMLGLLPVATSFARRKLHLGYRRLASRSGLPWSGRLSAHEFHFASILAEEEGETLFSAEAADGAPLPSMGLRAGRVMGSFAHVIDRAP